MGEARRTGEWHKSRFSGNRRGGTVNRLEGTDGNACGAPSRLAHLAMISSNHARFAVFDGAGRQCNVKLVTIRTPGGRACRNGRDPLSPTLPGSAATSLPYQHPRRQSVSTPHLPDID